MNLEEKKSYLLSSPDVISPNEALDTVSPWFDRVWFGKSKAEANLQNYFCFHSDCRYGVYIENHKFYLVIIKVPASFLGFKGGVTIQKVVEILKDSWNFYEAPRISGASTFMRKTDSEKSFLKFIMSFNEDPEDIKERTEAAKAEAEAKAKAEAIALAEAAAKAKAEAEAKAKAEAIALAEAAEKAKAEAIALAEAAAKAKAEAEAKAKAEAIALAKAAEKAKAKAKVKAHYAKIAKAEAAAKAEAETDLAYLYKKYDEKVAEGYSLEKVTLGMPRSYVIKLKGLGYDRKRTTTRDGASIKEKYGKYFKKLSSGLPSSTPSFKMQVEYEKGDDENTWLVTSFKDF